jgi:metal-responsive CopG/Arc/MetJ family transcriptional regulator
METVTVKFENEFLNKVERAMKKHLYATKAEFIREAIRNQLHQLEKKEYMMRAFKTYGLGKNKHSKITDKQLHQAREKAAKELARELGVQ